MDRRRKIANITFTEKPELRAPYMVCGINGWVDGGEASTGTVRYLARKLGAKQFAQIPISRFHIFQVPGQLALRPYVRMEDGIIKEHRLARNRFFYAALPESDHDMILFRGTEPNLNWEEYADALLDLAEEYSVERIYLLGGVLDKTPHTREPGMSCACSSLPLKEEMKQYNVAFSNYEGPGSFATTLLNACQERQIPMVSLTVRATYYPEYNIVIPYNAKAIRAVLKRLKVLMQLKLDISDLDKESAELESKLSFMIEHNPEFRTYVEELEKNFVEVKYEEPLDMSASEAVQIAEELVKRKKEE